MDYIALSVYTLTFCLLIFCSLFVTEKKFDLFFKKDGLKAARTFPTTTFFKHPPSCFCLFAASVLNDQITLKCFCIDWKFLFWTGYQCLTHQYDISKYLFARCPFSVPCSFIYLLDFYTGSLKHKVAFSARGRAYSCSHLEVTADVSLHFQ